MANPPLRLSERSVALENRDPQSIRRIEIRAPQQFPYGSENYARLSIESGRFSDVEYEFTGTPEFVYQSAAKLTRELRDNALRLNTLVSVDPVTSALANMLISGVLIFGVFPFVSSLGRLLHRGWSWAIGTGLVLGVAIAELRIWAAPPVVFALDGSARSARADAVRFARSSSVLSGSDSF